MKKFNTSPISGMQELLPGMQSEFNRLKTGIQEIFAAHGFQNIETPVIERTEVLLAKAGGDTEKQIYKVVKTKEASEGADQALRFDHTVPLARYVAEHSNDLAFPFKVSQIGRNFRGERAQKGRFREFYQCDVDVIGWQTLPLAYDADVIMTLVDALSILPFKKLQVRVSNRKILSGLIAALGISDRQPEIFNVVDHIDKMELSDWSDALVEAAGSEKPANILKDYILGARGEWREVIATLEAKGDSSWTLYQEGVAELKEVLSIIDQNLSDDEHATFEIVADMSIIRGLDYYTGTVFETFAPDYFEIGSLCSGGRYDNLASNYSEQKFPGVGGSIGLTRLFYVLREYGLVKLDTAKPIDYCVVPFSENEFVAAEQLAGKLRAGGSRVDVVLTDKKLGDKLKYAAKIAKFACVVGENEVRSGIYEAKNLETGEVTRIA